MSIWCLYVLVICTTNFINLSTYLTISDTIDRMTDIGGMSSNFSLSDVTMQQNSTELEGSVLTGKLDGYEGGNVGMFLSPPEGNDSNCSINATLFHTYIKSEYLGLSYNWYRGNPRSYKWLIVEAN